MLLDPPSFLVLDEPTNHLDLATREMLVEALRHGPDQLLLDGLLVAVADESHVQLDHVGREDGERCQPCGQIGHAFDLVPGSLGAGHQNLLSGSSPTNRPE